MWEFLFSIGKIIYKYLPNTYADLVKKGLGKFSNLLLSAKLFITLSSTVGIEQGNLPSCKRNLFWEGYEYSSILNHQKRKHNYLS